MLSGSFIGVSILVAGIIYLAQVPFISGLCSFYVQINFVSRSHSLEAMKTITLLSLFSLSAALPSVTVGMCCSTVVPIHSSL